MHGVGVGWNGRGRGGMVGVGWNGRGGVECTG